MNKRWVTAGVAPESFFVEFPELNPSLLQLLWNRNMRTQETVDVFLGPEWSRDAYSPFLFLHMNEAVARVYRAFEEKQMITVHGDYDADGVCGSAVLVSSLREIARAFLFDETLITSYIPHREKEGYGLSIETVDILHRDQKTQLIITVDCGISNKPAIDHADSYHIDTIVCDHHTMPKDLPEKAILIHPLVPGETFPNKFLCGTGVAFKLACGLYEEARIRGAAFPEGQEKWLLDLVAIATVTDMVPMVGENRVLEQFGLLVLNKTRRVGLRALIEISGGKFGELDTTSIGFQIGPRLNAAGRMEHAREALNLLIEEDEMVAKEKAERLHSINKDRQKRSEEMYQEAKVKIQGMNNERCIIVASDGWQAGLVGLVAGKLMNEFNVPVLVFGKEGDRYIGSGRSNEILNLMPVLHASSEFLLKYGGHPQACGLTIIGEENYRKAEEKMREVIEELLKSADLTPILPVDAEILLKDISWELHDGIERCKPHGMGNPPPTFVSRNIRVIGMNTVGEDGKHLKLTFQGQYGKVFKMIGFKFGFWNKQITIGDSVDVVYEITLNEWNGNRELQGKIVDLKLSQASI